jgi:hypothetical protein
VRRQAGGGWEPLGTLGLGLDAANPRADGGEWAFAVDREGRAFVARSRFRYPDPFVETWKLERGTWTSLGGELSAGPWWFPWTTAGKPALATSAGGDTLLMFDAGPQKVLRWNAGAAGWDHLAPDTFVLATGYGAPESSLAAAPDGRLFGMTTWSERQNGNIGCYDTGVTAALFEASSWTDLGELKVDRRLHAYSACALADVHHASLAVDDGGVAWIATVESPLVETLGQVRVFRRAAAAWELDGDWPGAAPRPRVSLAASSPATQWLSFTQPDGEGSRLLLHRRRGGAWTRFAELRWPSPDVEGSFVCADAAGNPVITVGDDGGGVLLHFTP